MTVLTVTIKNWYRIQLQMNKKYTNMYLYSMTIIPKT